MKKISKSQIRLLRGVAARIFGECNCDGKTSMCSYHAFLYDNFFSHDTKLPIRHSTKQLTRAEADVAIKHLMGAVPGKRRYFGSGVGICLTQSQADLIAKLERDLGWDKNPRRLRGFITRQTGGKLKSVEMLTNREASKVITGMGKLLTAQKQDSQ